MDDPDQHARGKKDQRNRQHAHQNQQHRHNLLEEERTAGDVRHTFFLPGYFTPIHLSRENDGGIIHRPGAPVNVDLRVLS